MKSLSVVLTFLASATLVPVAFADTPVEAPAAFDNLTNGFVDQDDFDEGREDFDEQEDADEGLGPVYNARSCGECHQTTTSGGLSQVSELRVARFDGTTYTDHPGGSLINDRATDAAIQERVLNGFNVRTFRSSLNVLGDGFVEALADSTIEGLAAAQPSFLRGQVIKVPVNEAAPGTKRVARFGWKNQHASLVSFAADAYLNEMGITSPLEPNENTSNGTDISAYDPVPDPEAAGTPEHPNSPDIDNFVNFMRGTKAPPRDETLAATPDAVAGAALFNAIGCALCHTPTLVTAPVGTPVNGGTLVIPAALGNKKIHPFSDFLLHDVGTGDGIIQNGGPSTRNKLRTPPLWGLRTRSRLMHDTLSLTRTDAILRHGGQATVVRIAFQLLSPSQRNRILTFLDSL